MSLTRRTPILLCGATILAAASLAAPSTPAVLFGVSGIAAEPSRATESRQVRLYDVGDLAGSARLDRLAESLGMLFEEVSQRIVAVTGNADQHRAFQDGLQTVRAAASAGRVSVEVEARRGTGAAPVAGTKASAELMRATPVYGARTVAGANRPSAVSSIEKITYVRSLIPVVGSQSAAYQTNIQEAQSGMEASIFVGAVHEGRAVVRVVGTISQAGVTVAPTQPPPPEPDVAGWRASPAPLQQLRQRTRMIDAEVDVGAEPIVAAVVDDLEGDGWMAITVRVAVAP